jgi:drug/metabolite transporter (DMT)-like permease
VSGVSRAVAASEGRPVLGAFLALLAAATFALNNTSVRRGVLTGSVLQAMAITITIGVPISLAVGLVSGGFWTITDFSWKALLVIGATGMSHFVIGRYCNYRATKALGTNLVGPIQQLNLIISLVLAIWILGEELTPFRLVGIVLVLLGPTFTLEKRKKDADPEAAAEVEKIEEEEVVAASAAKPPVFVPDYVEGYTFGLLSAVAYGLTPILIRIGLEGKGLAASIAANFLASFCATMLLLVIMLWPGNIRHVMAIKREAAKWFAFSGVLVCVSQIFMYMAMSIAPVTVVSPISRLSILLRLYFSRMINPHHEHFGGQVIVGTVVSLLGALILSLSVEAVTAVLPLPDSVVSVLRWHWP